MKKPNFSIITELDNIIQNISQTEIDLKNLNKQLNDFPNLVKSLNFSEHEKIEIAKYLYWSIPNIKTESIKNIFGDIKNVDFSKLIKTNIDNIICKKCLKPIIFKSRCEYKSYIYDNNYEFQDLCKDCYNKALSERCQKNEEKDKLRLENIHNKINTLKSMEYSEYLKTEHWQETRKRHLKYSNYKCQMCNSGNKTLHVHHKTYENRGNEDKFDLITLCEDCHTLFHKNSKIK